MIVDYYHTLFKSEGTSNMHLVLDHVGYKVTDAMNNFLCAPFDENEVKIALFQMFHADLFAADLKCGFCPKMK